LVCIDAAACDTTAEMTAVAIELDTNAYARGKDTVNWELN